MKEKNCIKLLFQLWKAAEIDIVAKYCRSLSLPLPKQETLSRHSLLGPNGLRVQWMVPAAEIKVVRLNFIVSICLVSSFK